MSGEARAAVAIAIQAIGGLIDFEIVVVVAVVVSVVVVMAVAVTIAAVVMTVAVVVVSALFVTIAAAVVVVMTVVLVVLVGPASWCACPRSAHRLEVSDFLQANLHTRLAISCGNDQEPLQATCPQQTTPTLANPEPTQ